MWSSLPSAPSPRLPGPPGSPETPASPGHGPTPPGPGTPPLPGATHGAGSGEAGGYTAAPPRLQALDDALHGLGELDRALRAVGDATALLALSQRQLPDPPPGIGLSAHDALATVQAAWAALRGAALLDLTMAHPARNAPSVLHALVAGSMALRLAMDQLALERRQAQVALAGAFSAPVAGPWPIGVRLLQLLLRHPRLGKDMARRLALHVLDREENRTRIFNHAFSLARDLRQRRALAVLWQAASGQPVDAAGLACLGAAPGGTGQAMRALCRWLVQRGRDGTAPAADPPGFRPDLNAVMAAASRADDRYRVGAMIEFVYPLPGAWPDLAQA